MIPLQMQGQQPPPEGQQPPPPQMSPADMAKAMAEAFKSAIPPQQAPQVPQQQMTPEMFAQLTRAFKYDPQWTGQMFGETATPETFQAAMERIVAAAVQNAIASSHLITQNYMKQLTEELGPDLEDLRHLSQSRFYDSLYEGHDGLKTYDPLIRHMLPSFEQAPEYPQDRGARAEFVRNKIVEIIKKTNPQFDPKGQTSPNVTGGHQGGQQPQHSSANSSGYRAPSPPPSLSGGGQGAASGSGQGGQQRAPLPI